MFHVDPRKYDNEPMDINFFFFSYVFFFIYICMTCYRREQEGRGQSVRAAGHIFFFSFVIYCPTVLLSPLSISSMGVAKFSVSSLCYISGKTITQRDNKKKRRGAGLDVGQQ